MKRISLILLILFCLLVPKAQAETIEESLERFKLFTGCEPIGLSLESCRQMLKK